MTSRGHLTRFGLLIGCGILVATVTNTGATQLLESIQNFVDIGYFKIERCRFQSSSPGSLKFNSLKSRPKYTKMEVALK